MSSKENQERTDVFTVTALRKALDQLAIPEDQTELILEQLFVPSSSSSSAAAATTTPVASVVAAPSAVAVAVTSGTDK